MTMIRFGAVYLVWIQLPHWERPLPLSKMRKTVVVWCYLQFLLSGRLLFLFHSLSIIASLSIVILVLLLVVMIRISYIVIIANDLVHLGDLLPSPWSTSYLRTKWSFRLREWPWWQFSCSSFYSGWASFRLWVYCLIYYWDWVAPKHDVSTGYFYRCLIFFCSLR